MQLHAVQKDGIRDNNTGVILPPQNNRMDKIVRFYRRKFHFITIPIGVVLSAVHLKFAIEYLGQCPIQPMINIYMIVHAAVTLTLILLALAGVIVARYGYPRPDENNNPTNARYILLTVFGLTLIFFLFSFSWLVAGSVWVFGAKANGVQGTDPSATTTYCQSNLYRAAFVLLIIHYVLHGIIISLLVLRCIFCKRGNLVPPNVGEKERI